MKSFARCGAAALALFAIAPLAMADNCSALVGKTQCFTFKYSSGGKNSYTAVFGANGAFSFTDGVSSGTYSCAGGLGLTEIDYLYGGVEHQQWYSVAGAGGNTMKGNGKSLDNGYMYKLTSVAGSCAADSESKSGSRQDE